MKSSGDAPVVELSKAFSDTYGRPTSFSLSEMGSEGEA